MVALTAVLVALVLFAVAAVAAGRGGSLQMEDRATGGRPLPLDRPVAAADIAALRFGLALRGYRMAEVDAALDRLGNALLDRDGRIAALEAELGRPGRATGPDAYPEVPPAG